jgi:predicted helicase
MLQVFQVSSSHKAIKRYYEQLAGYQAQGITNEQALRPAFQALLEALARELKWTLVLELRMENGAIPDGTLWDGNGITRGYWEAKDPGDDLEAEIKKKIARGYPLRNIIFEDTRRAILYQNGKRDTNEYDLTQPAHLASLLTTFFSYLQPETANFNQAVERFKEQVPELARGLKARIQEEHTAYNPAFASAFSNFYTLCQTALDPNISRDAVDDMLVQHLLTERLFRTVFDNDEFTSRNVIAAEIEKVIQALTSRQFNRHAFLKSLDHFYLSIEAEARSQDDWSQKQRFLNMVYERFFQGYSVKEADTRGIVYTPQEIVDFMCASVEEVLRREFNSSIATPGVQILDPCTGTGNFIVNLLRRIGQQAPQHLAHKYQQDLFANEIMLLPYYIASMNIEHEYFTQKGSYAAFDGLCFADTLGLEGAQIALFSEANAARVEIEKAAEIKVIIGNPPYNVGQENENDNNKNRKYPGVDGRIKETYAKASKATLNTKLYDAYVKFFRWATDRLQGRDGIVCFVSNNGFLDGIAFDGFRKHLQEDFTAIYHLDLGGDARKQGGGNVFGIRVGVGITIAVRLAAHSDRKIYYYQVPEDWHKEQKLEYLRNQQHIGVIEWQELVPDQRFTWLTEGMQPEFASFLPMGSREAKAMRLAELGTLFKTYSLGVSTNRDDIAYDFNSHGLVAKVQRFIEEYNAEVSRWARTGKPQDIDSFVRYEKIKWSRNLKRDLRNERYITFNESNIRKSLYRPFTSEWLYHADGVVDERGSCGSFFPTPATEAENAIIVVGGYGRKEFAVFLSNLIPNLNFYADPAQCFPYYTYAEDGSNRRENITDWALAQFRAAYGEGVTKRDIFDYVYGLLHHPLYRERYAENLKRELPRIPLVAGRAAFETLRDVGARLAALHLGYEQAPEYPLLWRTTPNMAQDWRVKKMRLTPDKTALVYNDWLTLEGIPAEAFAYRLGNRSALEWVLD